MTVHLRFLIKSLIASVVICAPIIGMSQIDDSQLGAWYAYHFKTEKSSQAWGMQGDVQWRNWNIAGDLEQVVMRGAATYIPKKTKLTFALGYANVQTFSFGESADRTVNENRIFQDLSFPLKLGQRVFIGNRFRYEQRFFDGDEFRTRYRYSITVSVPLNQREMDPRALFLRVSNEVFLNGVQRGGEQEMGLFDRNRVYLGIGTFLNSKIKVQTGLMGQYLETTGKKQLLVSIHHQI